jgi:hypothetical protein
MILLSIISSAERPYDDRHVLERVAQRPDDVRVADPALRARVLDRRAARLAARDRAHRVPVGDERAREREAATAAADEEHAHPRGR